MRLSDYIGKYWAGAEVMYGIIITMTFTSIIRDFPNIPDALVNKIILAALFCCVAWGFADGFFYLWERRYIVNRENRIIDISRSGETSGQAISLVGEELDDTILRKIPAENRLHLYEKLLQFLSTSSDREKLSLNDALTIILGTFFLSAGACLVMVVPFVLLTDDLLALGISNATGILLLFIVGYFRASGRPRSSRVLLGFSSSLIGVIIAAITVVLGG